MSTKIRHLAHAACFVQCGGFSILTDPWFDGPAYFGGWEHSQPVPDDWQEVLRDADYIYISHTHPDHLHEPTLRHLHSRVHEPIFLVPAFESKSVVNALSALGFGNMILALPSSGEIHFGDGVAARILYAADGRDDSGLYVTDGSWSCLLCTDANRLNGGDLPKGVDVLATAFAGGASGYPLCYENYTPAEQDARAEQQRLAMVDYVDWYIERVRPKAWMPYAGYYRPTDAQVAAREHKTTAADMAAHVARKWPGVQILKTWQDQEPRAPAPVPMAPIQRYFEGCGFRHNLFLWFVPCRDDWTPDPDADGVFVDFREGKFMAKVEPGTQMAAWAGDGEMRSLTAPLPHKVIRIKTPMLDRLLAEGLSWDDLFIGFHLRVFRDPDQHVPELWRYFSVDYVGERVATYGGKA